MRLPPLILIAASAGLALVLTATILLRPAREASAPPVAASPSPAAPPRPGLSVAPAAARRPRPPEPPAFWETARIPEPAQPRPPTAAIPPSRTTPPTASTATEAAVRRLETLPTTPANVRQLNDQTVVWFAQSPRAAAAWIERTPRLGDLSPALAIVAETMAERGHRDTALDWLEIVPDPEIQHRAMLDIYNLEARRGRVTREALVTAGFTPDELAVIFQAD